MFAAVASIDDGAINLIASPAAILILVPPDVEEVTTPDVDTLMVPIEVHPPEPPTLLCKSILNVAVGFVSTSEVNAPDMLAGIVNDNPATCLPITSDADGVYVKNVPNT